MWSWGRSLGVNNQSPLCTRSQDDGQAACPAPPSTPPHPTSPPLTDRVIYQNRIRVKLSARENLLRERRERRRTKIKNPRDYFPKHNDGCWTSQVVLMKWKQMMNKGSEWITVTRRLWGFFSRQLDQTGYWSGHSSDQIWSGTFNTGGKTEQKKNSHFSVAFMPIFFLFFQSFHWKCRSFPNKCEHRRKLVSN